MSCVLLHTCGRVTLNTLVNDFHTVTMSSILITVSYNCHKHGINTSITVTTQSCFIFTNPLGMTLMMTECRCMRHDCVADVDRLLGS